MLEELLKRIATGGIHSYAQLAREMDISPDLLQQMLEDLGRMGYLRRVENACEEACSHCENRATCAIHGPSEIWTLTEKWEKAQHGG